MKIVQKKADSVRSSDMFRIKYLVLCVISLFMWQHIHAAKLTDRKNLQWHDEALKTYVYTSDIDENMQADATTMYPPLIEEQVYKIGDGEIASPVIVSEEAQPPLHLNENNTFQSAPEAVPNSPIQQYANPYYPMAYPNYQNYYYPWPYIPQQLQQYSSQPNMGQQTVYTPPQTEYEGILVPVQTMPTRIQSLPQASQAQYTQSNLESSSSSTQNTTPSTASTNAESSKTPAALNNRNSFDLALLLQALLPQNIIQLIITLGSFILNSFSTLAFAGAITSLVCSLTPVCSISFGSFPFGIRKILIDGAEISTIQRVRRAAEMVTNALDKYEKIQKGVETLTNTLKQAQKKF